METLIATTKVSEEGNMTVKMPEAFNGQLVDVVISIKTKPTAEACDEKGWAIGFWERLAADPITDPAFKRYPQPEADPPPSFE